MHILVIGGAGYIGSVTSELLLARGHQVSVFDNFSTGYRAAVPPGATSLCGDIADGAQLDQLFAAFQYDAVMHFAAKSIVPASRKEPGAYFANNVAAVIGLLNAMTAHQVQRFVFSSTAAVYGQPEQMPVPEDAPLCPTSPYGTSKVMVEETLPWYEEAQGLRFACLRYFNAAGASERFGEDHNPETHLIPVVLKAALGQHPGLTVYGSDYATPDGTAIRDYVHVLDLADAHIRALERLDTGSLVCNLGTERGYSVAEVLETARQVTGAPLPVHMGPRREGDPPITIASSERAWSLLGWRAERGLGQMIEDAWRWRQQHPHGYEPAS